MRRKLIPFLSIVSLLALSIGAQADGVDKLIRARMAERRIPGLSLAVIGNGKIIKAKGYGLANTELNVPASPETVYRLGSTGKLFIATGIMLLVEEGKISLDDTVSKYLAGAPEAWQKITVRHLLSHTSGVAHNLPGYDPLKVQSDLEVIKIAYPTPLLFTPGEKVGYSNLGYFILGEIISKASGKPWSEYVTERIFKPLQMNATRTTSMADIVPNRASGYVLNGDRLQNVQNPLGRRASGFLSTVLDLAKFDAALYTEKILKKTSLEQMWQPVKENDAGVGSPKGSYFGFGWGVDRVNGHRVVFKGGTSTGFRATFFRFVDDNLTVVILANGEGWGPLQPLAYEVANFYIKGLAYKDTQASETPQ